MFKVGDKVRYIHGGKVFGVFFVGQIHSDHIRLADKQGNLKGEKYHLNGAGFFGPIDGPPMITLITPLEELL